jgi:hypothetical protein
MPSAARATSLPLPGPQTEFPLTPTDICIYGGAAGGGKTVGLILEPLRHVSRRSRWPGHSAACRPVPSNRARQEARQPASPRPRTGSSNPAPSSSESMQTRSTLVGLIASSLLTFRAMVPIQRKAVGSVRGRAEPQRMVEDRRYEYGDPNSPSRFGRYGKLPV